VETFALAAKSFSEDGTSIAWVEQYVTSCKETICSPLSGTCMQYSNWLFTVKTASINAATKKVDMATVKTVVNRSPGQLANSIYFMKQAGYIMVEYINPGKAASYRVFSTTSTKNKLVAAGNPQANDLVQMVPSPSGKYIAVMFRPMWSSNLSVKDLQATATVRILNACDLSTVVSTTVPSFALANKDDFFSWSSDLSLVSFEFSDYPSGVSTIKRFNLVFTAAKSITSQAVTSVSTSSKTFFAFTTSGALSRTGEYLRSLKNSGSDPACVADLYCQDTDSLKPGFTAYKIEIMAPQGEVAGSLFGGVVQASRTSGAFSPGALCAFPSFNDETDVAVVNNSYDDSSNATIFYVSVSIGSLALVAIVIGAVVVVKRTRKNAQEVQMNKV
jgi:hypothetical protein